MLAYTVSPHIGFIFKHNAGDNRLFCIGINGTYICGLLPQSPVTMYDKLTQESYKTSRTVWATHDKMIDSVSSHFIVTVSENKHTVACNQPLRSFNLSHDYSCCSSRTAICAYIPSSLSLNQPSLADLIQWIL